MLRVLGPDDAESILATVGDVNMDSGKDVAVFHNIMMLREYILFGKLIIVGEESKNNRFNMLIVSIPNITSTLQALTILYCIGDCKFVERSCYLIKSQFGDMFSKISVHFYTDNIPEWMSPIFKQEITHYCTPSLFVYSFIFNKG